MARRTRRLWTDEEKRSICFQTTAPGVSVARVALRYTVNANLIFKWLRDPKYRPKPGTGSGEAGLRFLPVEIVAEAKAPMADPGGPAPVLFWSFESNTRHQGDRIWQRYTATSSSGIRFASR
ncbi:MAG: transposase, partial [Paracoccaceae bacterium]